MAKKNKFDLNSPSLGQNLVKDNMSQYASMIDLDNLPEKYNINKLTTEIEEPVVEWSPENAVKHDGEVMYELGKGLVSFLDNTKNLVNYIGKERLSVGLSKLQDNLMETEARWLPEIEQAQAYLNAKQIVDSIPQAAMLNDEQRQAVQVVNELEPKIKESAKTNPYIRDIFYDTNNRGLHGNMLINVKAALNDFTDKNIFNVNPFDNIATALQDNALNEDDTQFLWDAKQQQIDDKQRQELLSEALNNAKNEYGDKTDDILKRQNTLKKGGWLYDPASLSKEFEDKVNTSELSITDPKSWFYNLGHIGSSLSEIELMFLQTGASVLANKSARSLAVKSALTKTPYVGHIATAIALGEQAFNLWMAKHYRQSETASEVFDNYQQRILTSAIEGKSDLDRVYQQWIPQLEKLGYEVDDMDDQEILQAGLAQGLSTDQQDFEAIRSDAFNGLQEVRDVNNALSYVDYLETMPFSYGGKILWNNASKQLAKRKGIQRPLEEVPGVFEQLGLDKVASKTIAKALTKTSGNIGKNITRKHLLENIGSFAKANGITMLSERTEEGIQSVVGSRYQRGEYDKLGEKGIGPVRAAAEAGLLGLEANLAYFGLSNDNYLNTDEELRKAMDIGGFIGFIMPIAGNAVKIKDIANQYASDKNMNMLVAKGYDNAEKDNKMDVFLDATNSGKGLKYVTDYLESMKSFKQSGVTDQMIEEDKQLATKIWSEYHNKSLNDNLKNLGIDRGSDDHKRIIKNYVHISERLKEAESDFDYISKELEKLVDAGQNNLDEIFLQKAKESYDATFKDQQDDSKKPTIEEYSRVLYNISFLKLQRQALSELKEDIKNRKKQLSEVASDTGLRVNISGVKAIDKEIDNLSQQVNDRINSLSKTLGINDINLVQDPINSDEIKQYFTAYAMNKAVRDNIEKQVLPYITGRLSYENAVDILEDTKLLKEMEDLVQTDKHKIAMANALFVQHMNRTKSQEKIATREKEEEGEVLPEPEQSDIQTEPTQQQSSQQEQTKEQVYESPVLEGVKPEPTVQEGIVDSEPQVGALSTADEILKAEEEAEAQRKGKQLIIEPGSDDVAIVEPTLEEQTQSGIQEEEEIRNIQASTETVIEQQSDLGSVQIGTPSPAELEAEDVNNRTAQSTEDEPKVEQPIQDNTPLEDNVVEKATEKQAQVIKDESNPVPPTSDQVEESKQEPEQTPITIVDGGVYVNGTTFVSDDVLQTEYLLSNEDIEIETYGETAFANKHPERVVNDTDALTNRKTQKVKHVSNTFFFQPNATEPMNVTVNGKPVVFTNSKGEKLDVLSGSVLASRLIKNGWLDTTNQYFIVTNHKYGDGDVYKQAIHLVIEDTDGVMIASLRTPDYVDKEIASGNYNQEQIKMLQQQKEQLISLRQKIVNSYLGSNKVIPTNIIKTVKPAGLRISNGEFNNQKTADEAPLRRKLTEVSDLNLPTDDVIALDEAISNGELEIGYGTGSVEEFVSEPFVIRRLGSDTELVDSKGKGRSGALYLIPKKEQTPNGTIAPIQLSIVKLDTGIYGEDIELGSGNKVNSVAELAYKLLVGEIKLAGAEQDVLDIIVRNGSKTLISKEVGEKYPFLLDKMLYYNETDPNRPHLQYAVKNSNGTYSRVEFNPNKVSEQVKKNAIRKIAKDMHWNTEKYALLEPIPSRIVNLGKSYFKQFPNEKVYKIAGLKDLSFTKEDLGIGTEHGPVSLLAWMINTGKIQTDLGDTIFKAPFIYADGVAVPQITESVSQQPKVDSKPIVIDKVKWARYSQNNYEVSSKGDKRFSALYAKFKPGTVIDGIDVGDRTIENVYQSVIKKSRKGQAPSKESKLYNESLKTKEEREDFSYTEGYLPLWQQWAKQNPDLIQELRERSAGKTLTDQFANTRVSQARALADILNNDQKHNIETKEDKELQQKEVIDKPTIQYVSTEENWSEEQIRDWMKANAPQYKYKVGKWQVIRKDGQLKAAMKVAKRGLASQFKGEGKFNETQARKWLHDTLGLDKSDVIVSEAVFRMAGAPEVYGAVKTCMDRLSGDYIARIFLSEQAGQGIEYHEAFHYVSNLLLNNKVRENVYSDYISLHPEFENATKREIEEALAEEFKEYMLNENRPFLKSLKYRIKKAFNAIKYMLGITRNGNLVRTLFKQIRKGEFKRYKPSESLIKEFNDKFGGFLSYYIPGVSEDQLKKIASIGDASTFYAVVDSLNATVMDTFNISKIEDLQDLPQKIDDIFEDILVTNLEMGMYPEETEQLIRDVISNKEVFKKQIDDYLRNFSIIKKNDPEAQQDEQNDIDTGKPDNTWDKESYTISKKANVAFKAKLLLYSIPKTRYEFDPETGEKVLVEVEDDLLMTTRSEDFNVVWNKVLENLWNVESYLDIVDECYNLGKTDPFFMTLYNKLTSKDDPIDEVTKTQLLNTVKSAKNSLVAIVVEKRVLSKAETMGSDEQIQYVTEQIAKELNWRIQDSDVYRKTSRLPKQWSNAFFMSDLIDVNSDGTRTINSSKFLSAIWSKKTKLDSLLNRAELSKEQYTQARELFIDICNNLSINMDDLSLDYLLSNNGKESDYKSLKQFWHDTTPSTSFVKSILNNINRASQSGSSSIATRGGGTARSFDRIFTTRNPKAQINQMAIAWGRTHPSPEEFSVTGAGGNLVYPITENNYMSDQIRWLKKDINGKRDLLSKNPYSANSLLLATLNSKPSAIKLSTYLNLEENLQNTNRDYFGISPIEDYISKMTFGFNNHLFCPTMSDKKTWHTISGIQMVKDFLPSTVFSEYEYDKDTQELIGAKYTRTERRFSDRTIGIFKGYLRDEYNAIQKYFATKKQVIDNPNLQVGNYYGTKKGNYADGNGGRFRYFNILTIDGVKYNLNEQLAKAEYANDEVAIKNLLDVIKQALDKDTSINDAINTMLVEYANDEVQKAIELGVISKKLENKYIPDNILHTPQSVKDSKSKKNKKAKEEDEFIVDESFETKFSDIDSQDKESDLVYSVIASHAINSAISTIEIEKCFTGDPALYKWQKELVIYKPNDASFEPVISNERSLKEWVSKRQDNNELDGNPSEYSAYYMITGRDVDKIKRLSSVLSTGTNLRTKFGKTKDEENRTNSKFQVLQLKDNEIGSTVYDTLYQMFRTSLIKDMYQKEFNLTDQQALNGVKPESINATLGRLKKKNPKAIEFIEKQAKASAKPYSDGEINQADAAVYIRPEFYKKMMIALGEWSDEIAEAYRIMEESDDWLSDVDLYNKAVKAITQPLKMVYFGDHFDETLGMNVNTFDKMALFPLFKSFAKADNKYLYDRMNDESKGVIDMVAFESAIKVGGRQKLSYYKDDKVNLSELDKPSDIDGRNGNGLATYTQDLNQIRLQLNTDPHEHLERAFGTQAIKIGFANVVDTRNYGANKGLAVKGADIKRNIMDAINSLSKIGQDEIRKEFFTKGHVDNRKIVNYLQRQATNSGMSAEIVANLTIDDNGDILIPIEAQSIRDWIQTKITSFVNKAVVDVNTPGGSAIQMSSFAYEAVGRNVKTDEGLATAFNEGKKLKFLAKEGHMQVILSENFFRDILPKELKDASYSTKRKWLIDNNIIGDSSKPYGIGYRIPTQGLSSMFAFQVADIMPQTIGDTIIVPEEFTAMTGSDFDVDKLYLATYAYKDGVRVDSEEDSKEGNINKLLDNYSLVLTDFTNIAETRASIDTLTKILQKEVLPIVKPSNKTEVKPMYELAPSFQLSRKTEYTGGKAGIAPFALNSTNHALTQFTHLCINYSNSNRYNLGALDEVTGEDNQRIMDWLSAMINAHVDVAKDPYIMTLNVNAITYNMTSLLLRGGKGESTFYFLAQPALRRFTKEMLESKGIIGAETGVTEKDKLKQIAKDCMEYLRDTLINMPSSSEDKATYTQYYNGLAGEYGLSQIPGYDSVEVDYSQVFNKEAASKSLKDPYSAHGLYQQVISIRAYQDLSQDTEVLSNLVQLSQIDTKKFGNILPLQLNFKRRLDRYIDNYQARFYIKNRDDIEKPINYYLSSTFLKRKLDSAINTPRILLSNQVIEATKGYKKIFNAACDFFIGNSSDGQLVTDLSKIITTMLRTKAVVNNLPDFKISDSEFLSMLKGPNSMAKQLTKIKNELRKRNDLPAISFNGVIKNEILNYLQEYASDGSLQEYDRIVTSDNALTNTSTYENRLLSSYQDLLECEDSSIREFADKLGLYAYLTSFDNRGVDSFFDVITTAWKKSKGYPDAIKAAINIMNDDTLQGMHFFGFDAERIQNGNYSQIFTEIARNASRNEKLVPTYELNQYDRKLNLVQFRDGSRPLPATFVSSTNKPFVKVLIRVTNPNDFIIYQKVASTYQVDANGDEIKNTRKSVYKAIPALGVKDDKKVYYEYNKMADEQSAFPQNAFPKEAIISSAKLESKVREAFKAQVDKNKSILMYESTDAIYVKTAEIVEQANGFEESEKSTYGSDMESTNEVYNTDESQSTNITVGEEESVPTTIIGETESPTLQDIYYDTQDPTQTIISDDVLQFSDETFGENPYFDTILESGIAEYENVQDVINSFESTENTLTDSNFSDEAYKTCKGE